MHLTMPLLNFLKGFERKDKDFYLKLSELYVKKQVDLDNFFDNLDNENVVFEGKLMKTKDRLSKIIF